MTRIAQPRTRLVNFRVTEAEYLQIREACLASGSRGLSAYARWATLVSVQPGPEPPSPPTSLQEWLDQRLTCLEANIRDVVQALASTPTDLPPAQGSE